MKKTCYIMCGLCLASFNAIAVNQATDLQENLPSIQMIQQIQSQFATALAQQDRGQISHLENQFLASTSLPAKRLNQQIEKTEKILTRIFKTEKNLTPKFIDYLYFEAQETTDSQLLANMKKNLLVSFLANEKAKIYIKKTQNTEQFLSLLQEKGALPSQIIVLDQPVKTIFQQIVEQIRKDFPNQTAFPITENRISIISPSSEIKPRLALATAIVDGQFKGVEIDDFSYLDQPRENLQHNNHTIRYKTFLAMLEGLE